VVDRHQIFLALARAAPYTWLPLIIALIGLPPAQAVDRPTYTGRVSITDGDTIRIAGTRIRLHGIDTPEATQTCQNQDGSIYSCGDMATSALAALIEKHQVTCRQTDKDRYGRIVAVCQSGPIDLNAEMVMSGWALAYRKYSSDYVDQEASAKAAGRGMWQGRFVKPWEWRSGKRLLSTVRKTGNNSSCQIKGNVSNSKKIYHVPGSRWYDSTRIDESKGEKWFCTEAEAAESGWSRAGNP
jgi:endonuclease YncB( thermonuclease family)